MKWKKANRIHTLCDRFRLNDSRLLEMEKKKKVEIANSGIYNTVRFERMQIVITNIVNNNEK